MEKIKQIILVAVPMVLAIVITVGALVVFATPTNAIKCGGVETNLISCDDSTKGMNAIWDLLLMVVNILTGGIGLASVGGIIYGAILYSSAGGNSENVKKAKTIISNVIIGIVLYLFMYSFLNYIIPGGVFN